MPTSTFPLWWHKDIIVAILNAARDGRSYQELNSLIMEMSGRNRPPRLRAWVMQWKHRPSDRPQARLAQVIAAYDPPTSAENAALLEVEAALTVHRSLCECGNTKDHPEDLSCRPCAALEAAN